MSCFLDLSQKQLFTVVELNGAHGIDERNRSKQKHKGGIYELRYPSATSSWMSSAMMHFFSGARFNECV
jgi:hypothetical protein